MYWTSVTRLSIWLRYIERKVLLPVDLAQPTIPGGINHPIIEVVLCLYLEESVRRRKSIEIRRGKAGHFAHDGTAVHIYNLNGDVILLMDWAGAVLNSLKPGRGQAVDQSLHETSHPGAAGEFYQLRGPMEPDLVLVANIT